MPELEISAALVGRKVANPARPEWGVGTVMRVQTTTAAGKPQHRVSIHFPTGHRTLLIPPATLTEPQVEQGRAAGWLDTIAGRTPDDRLSRLPEAVAGFVGTPRQHILALAALYEHTEDPAALVKWGRRQANVADPLTHWSRDELLVAFRRFCLERDSTLRIAAARLKQAEGAAAIDATLAVLALPIAEAMRAALRRPL